MTTCSYYLIGICTHLCAKWLWFLYFGGWFFIPSRIQRWCMRHRISQGPIIRYSFEVLDRARIGPRLYLLGNYWRLTILPIVLKFDHMLNERASFNKIGRNYFKSSIMLEMLQRRVGPRIIRCMLLQLF